MLDRLACHEDHPRLCGEKIFGRVRIFLRLGSPPPMRGKVNFFEFLWCLAGITPAYAGKSRALYAEAKNYEDHPRLCGEKGSKGCSFPVLIGSPPPMRGKVFPVPPQVLERRITPAYAGKSARTRTGEKT